MKRKKEERKRRRRPFYLTRTTLVVVAAPSPRDNNINKNNISQPHSFRHLAATKDIIREEFLSILDCATTCYILVYLDIVCIWADMVYIGH